MAAFGWYFFSTGGAIVCLLLGALWALVSRGSIASRRFLLVAALFYWLTGAYIVPDTLRQWLSSSYHPLQASDVPPGRTAVVLLGSGSYQVRDWSENHFAMVDRIGASRLLEAARAFRLVNGSYIISSGGLITVNERVRPAGITMAEALEQLGIEKRHILIDDRSKTTREEAVIIKDMLREHPVDRVVLVTSQLHMRRSVGTFKAVGVEVIPAIAREPSSIDTWWETLIPTDEGVKASSGAAHELGGMLVYSLRGWFRR